MTVTYNMLSGAEQRRTCITITSCEKSSGKSARERGGGNMWENCTPCEVGRSSIVVPWVPAPCVRNSTHLTLLPNDHHLFVTEAYASTNVGQDHSPTIRYHVIICAKDAHEAQLDAHSTSSQPPRSRRQARRPQGTTRIGMVRVLNASTWPVLPPCSRPMAATATARHIACIKSYWAGNCFSWVLQLEFLVTKKEIKYTMKFGKGPG